MLPTPESTISTPARVTRAKLRLRRDSMRNWKNGSGSDHSLYMNSTSNSRPPPSSQQINGESNQPQRSPSDRPSTMQLMAGRPSSTPRQSNCLKRSRRSGSCGRPQPTQNMASSEGRMICQNAHCQPTYSVHSPASGVPRLGPKVAVRA
ncbi:hypothetical protein D3C75_1013270 [compost metagenome]